MRKYLIVFAALLLTVALPFWLRPKEEGFANEAHETLVIVSPHVESIRREFTRAFQKHMQQNHGKRVDIQWVTPGGTSEIDRYLDTEFRAAFEAHWKDKLNLPWDDNLSGAVAVTKLPPDASEEFKKARNVFLNSSLGVKIDLFFGGGTFDFDVAKRKGLLVATDATGKFGPARIKQDHPDWFSESVIPQTFAGDAFYDPDLCWLGNCLGAFGICYNMEELERIGIYDPPHQWEDLANPMLAGHVAVADPGKSASAAKAFEMILQQEIQRAVIRAKSEAAKPSTPGAAIPTLEDAINDGWTRGMQIIQKIGANARYFTDSATKPPLDVAKGEAAAGMCIDFYGRSFAEMLQKSGGVSRLTYVTPPGGSALSPDAIAMFRGAQNPETATRFMEFVLSMEGQRIWGYKANAPGGPQNVALRRLPIRKDFYVKQELQHAADPEEMPYERTTFVYEPSYTAAGFKALRVVIRAMCIDTHEELKDAWKKLRETNFPPRALANFSDIRIIGYDKVMRGITADFNGKDKVKQARVVRDLASNFRNQYRNAIEAAENPEKK